LFFNIAGDTYPLRRFARSNSNESEPQLSQFLHAASDLVAGLAPYLLVLRMAKNHAFRSARENDVACSQGNVPGNVADNVSGIEDEVVGAG
jgi:hypothetical protein